MAIGKSLNLKNQKMTQEFTRTFCLLKEISFIVIILKREFNFFAPREESFPSSLKYIDVTRSTHTDMDVAQEKRIDDYWNVDENRSL